METTSVQLSEPREEDEIKKISSSNPNSFLHIFDYTQNTEVKSYSTVETNGEKCNLFLRAPDAETFSRLNHEIDQIERMKLDMEENRKEYFEQRQEEELFKYDLLLKLDDIDGSADRKVRETIKTSQAYQRGRKLGESLKQATPTSVTNNNTGGMAVSMLNNKAKKVSKLAAEIKEVEGEGGEGEDGSRPDDSSSDSSDMENSPDEESIAKTDKKSNPENSIGLVIKGPNKDLRGGPESKSNSSGSSASKKGKKSKVPQVSLPLSGSAGKQNEGFSFRGLGNRFKKTSTNGQIDESESSGPSPEKSKRLFGGAFSGNTSGQALSNMQKARSAINRFGCLIYIEKLDNKIRVFFKCSWQQNQRLTPNNFLTNYCIHKFLFVKSITA